MVLEGGAIENDGNGTMIATKSSVTNASRNPNLTQAQIEEYMTINMGIENFIWLEGLVNTDGTEITDMHIDGFVKFANSTTMLTLSDTDLEYWGIIPADVEIIQNVKDKNNNAYTRVNIPLTQNDVTTAYGNNLGYKGSYANYYIANNVVLVPNYNDPNDAVANAIIQQYHLGKTVVGIDVRNLYENGGMVHCVTQQQPISTSVSGINKNQIIRNSIYPNPCNESFKVNFTLIGDNDASFEIYNSIGQLVYSISKSDLKTGSNTLEINTKEFSIGMYTLVIKAENQESIIQKISLYK
jgi:agmatine deiminase